MADQIKIAGVDFRTLKEDEISQLDFMARKLGCDRYLFIGYNYEEAMRFARSHGLAGDGNIRIGVNLADEIGARGLMCLLTQYSFSDVLRKRVFELLNSYFTGKEIQRNIDEQEGTDGD